MSSACCCRICNVAYKTKNSSRSNIFVSKRDPSSVCWQTILNEIGVNIMNRAGLSKSICKPCQTSVLNVKRSLEKIKDWKVQFGNEQDGSRKRDSSDTVEAEDLIKRPKLNTNNDYTEPKVSIILKIY